MTFDDYWAQLAKRNGWTDDTQLSVKAGGLRKLVAQAWQKGAESAGKSPRDDFHKMFDDIIAGRRP